MTVPRLPGVTVSRLGADDEVEAYRLARRRGTPPLDEEEDEIEAYRRSRRQEDFSDVQSGSSSARPPAPPRPSSRGRASAAEDVERMIAASPQPPRVQPVPARDPIEITAEAEADPALRAAAKREVARQAGASPLGQEIATTVDPEVLTGSTRPEALDAEEARFDPKKIAAAQTRLREMREAATAEGDLPTVRHLQMLESNVGAFLSSYEEQSTFLGSTGANLSATVGNTRIQKNLARAAVEMPEALAELGLVDEDGQALSFTVPFGLEQFGGMAAADAIASLGGGAVARRVLRGVAGTADDVARTATAGSRAARLAPQVAAAARATARTATGLDIEAGPGVGELVKIRRAARGLSAAPADRVASAIATGATQGQLTSTIRETNIARAEGRDPLEAAAQGVMLGSVIGPAAELIARPAFSLAAQGAGSLLRSVRRGGVAEPVPTPDVPDPVAAWERTMGPTPKAAAAPPADAAIQAMRAEISQGVTSAEQVRALLDDGATVDDLLEKVSVAATPEARLAQRRALEAAGVPTRAALPAPKAEAAPAVVDVITPPDEKGTPNNDAVRNYWRVLNEAAARTTRTERAAAEAAAAANDPKRMPFRELLKRAQKEGLGHRFAAGPVLLGAEDEEDPGTRAMLELAALSMLGTTTARGVLRAAGDQATEALTFAARGATSAVVRETSSAADRVTAIARRLREVKELRTPITAEERATLLRFQREARGGWYDVRGLKADRPEVLAEMLRPLRDAKMERLHVVYTDEKGKVLAHTQQTSGHISAVQLGSKRGKVDGAALTYDIADRAKRLGATQVWFAHNHPSGLPVPSGGDVQFTEWLGSELKKQGVLVRGHVVLDHTHYGVVGEYGVSERKRLPAKSRVRAKVPLNETTELVDPAGRGMLEGRVNTPQHVALVAARADKKLAGQLVYVSTQGDVVAVEPHRPEALDKLNEWLPQRLKGLGAHHAFLVLPEATVQAGGVPRGAMRGAYFAPGLEDVIVDGHQRLVSLRDRNNIGVAPSPHGEPEASRGFVRERGYHATTADFDRFEQGKLHPDPEMPFGHWFASSPDDSGIRNMVSLGARTVEAELGLSPDTTIPSGPRAGWPKRVRDAVDRVVAALPPSGDGFEALRARLERADRNGEWASVVEWDGVGRRPSRDHATRAELVESAEGMDLEVSDGVRLDDAMGGRTVYEAIRRQVAAAGAQDSGRETSRRLLDAGIRGMRTLGRGEGMEHLVVFDDRAITIVREDPVAYHASVEAANAARPEPLAFVPQEYHNAGRYGLVRGVEWTPEAAADLAARVERVLYPTPDADPVGAALGIAPARRSTGQGLWEGAVAPNTAYLTTDDVPYRQIEQRAAAQQLLFGQEAAVAIKFLGDEVDLSNLSAAERVMAERRIKRTGVARGLTLEQKDAILQELSRDNIGASALEEAPGSWSLVVANFDDTLPPQFFDEAFDATVTDFAPGADTHAGWAESGYLATPRQAGESLLRAGGDGAAFRELAGLLDRIAPEYVASARTLGGDAAAERTSRIVAAKRRGWLALADAVDRPSPAARTERGRLTVAQAHEAVAYQRRASGKAQALAQLEGPAYVEGLAQEFAAHAREAIDLAVKLTGDPGVTTRWYGATIKHAEDIAAAFGLPEMVDDPNLAFLFHTVSSILSNGQAVAKEYLTAVPVMQQYLRTGKLSLMLPELADLPPEAVRAGRKPPPGSSAKKEQWRGAGDELPVPLSHRLNSHEAGLRKLQKLLDEKGLEGTVAYLSEPAVKSPTGKVRTKTTKETGEKRPVTPHVYEFAIKVGQYARDKLGLSTFDTDGVTVDVWMHRLERMLRGEAIPPKDSGPTQAEALRIQAATKRAGQLLQADYPDIQPRDIQAALWERAKLLYQEAGAREKPGAYNTMADAGREYVAGTSGRPARSPVQQVILQRYLPDRQLPALALVGLDEEDQIDLDTEVLIGGLLGVLAARLVGTAAERAVTVGLATDVARRTSSAAALVAAGSVLAGSDDPDVSRYGGGMALALGTLHALGTAPARVGGRAILGATRRLAAQSPGLNSAFGWLSPALVLTDESLAALRAARTAKVEGVARGRELQRQAAALGPAGDRYVSDLVEGEAWEDAALLDPDVRQAALQIAAQYQTTMQEVMRREVQLATLPDEVTARLPHDRYLPRVYAEHLSPDGLAPTSEYTSGRALTIRGPRRRILDVPVYEAQDGVAAAERYLQFATARGDAVQVSGAQAALQEARQELAAAIRERDMTRLRMGEVREFSWRAPAALEDAFGRIAAGELLTTLRATGDVHPEWLAARAGREAAEALHETALDAPLRVQLRDQLAAAQVRVQEIQRRLPELSVEGAESGRPGLEAQRQQMLAEYQAATDDVRQLRAAIDGAGDEQLRQQARLQMDAADMLERDLIARLNATDQTQWVRLPETAGYGALSGAVVRRAVADEIRGVADPAKWGEFMRFWKGAKTRYNLPTHVGNTASNVVMLHMAGLSWWSQPAYMARAFSDYQQNGPMTQLLRQRGVAGQIQLETGTPARAARHTDADVRALRARTRPETAQALEQQGVALPTTGDRVRGAGEAVDRVVSGLYQSEDDVFRVAAFDYARRELRLPDDQAVEWARANLGDFRRGQSSRAVRLARNSVFPFIAYPLAALPAFAQHIVDRPWRWVTLTAPLLLLNEWGQAESRHDLGPQDVGPRERDTVFGTLLPNLIQVPMARDDRSRVPAIDLTRWTPLSALVTGAPPATLGGAVDAPQILQPTGPAVDIPGMLLNRQGGFTDRELVPKGAGGGEAAKAIAQGVGDLMLPSMFGYSLRRLKRDVERKDPEGVALDVAGYVGVRPRYYGIGEDLRRARRERDERRSQVNYESREEMRKAFRSPELQRELLEERRRKLEDADSTLARRIRE